MTDDPVRVDIFLDDDPAPIGSYRPPASFELDSLKLPDGPHRLTIRATDRRGVAGVRVVEFMVRNGPGIAVVGINPGDIVEGKIPILVNAFGGGTEKEWEPARASIGRNARYAIWRAERDCAGWWPRCTPIRACWPTTREPCCAPSWTACRRA